MADNKQNSDTRNQESATNDKTKATGGAASPKQAKTEDSAMGDTGNNQNDSATGASSQGGGSASNKNTIDGIKDATGEAATQAIGQAKDKAASLIGEQKSNIASSISSVAESIRHIGENIGGGDDKSPVAAIAGKYSDNIAGQVEKFSSYLDDRELKELVSDVEKFARRNPALFVGGAFLLGVLAARFLKSSGQASRRRS